MSLIRPLFAAALLTLAACAAPAVALNTVNTSAQTDPAPASTLRESRRDWAQATSDIEADPAVRFGTLPNGMRYAILRNATPPGQASLRLRIDAGSLMEGEDQRGLAHFIEHMAFNGTTNVPEGDLLPILERLGLAFGPDTNAFTSFDQTVYQLDLPRTDDETVDTGLMIMREMAGEALMEADAIDRERGIVLSEERTRDSPGLRLALANYRFLLEGQLAPERFPIGTREVLSTAPRERFQAFYSAYYRPERAVLVAVGDFDVDAMETKIRAEFSDWTNPAPDGPEPDLGAVAFRSNEAFLFVEPGAQPMVEIAWVAPADAASDSRATRRRDLIQGLGFAVFNRRLQRLAREENPPFVAASASRSTVVDSQDQVSLTATYQPGEWQRAVTTLEQERRRILQFGITDAELQREITEWRAAYETYVAGAGTRRTPGLADAIAGSAHSMEVFTSPAQDLALFEAGLEGVTAETVMAELRTALEGDGPLVFVASPQPIEGQEVAILDVLHRAQAETLEAGAAVAEATWPYTDFGTPGVVAERAEIEDIGVTTVRFANGVRLTVKPTDFRQDQVLVSVNMGQGRRGLTNDHVTPLWGASSALLEGGLGQISREDLEAVLASRVYSTGFGLGEDTFTLSGATRPEDLQVQLQVLAAYVADPAFRPQAFERSRTVYATALDQLQATPSGVFGRYAGSLLRGGDLRWAFPDADQIAGAQLSELEALIRPVLTSTPVEIVIVGDVETDAVIQAVAATFGALPERGSDGPGNDAIRFPAGDEPVVLTHGGRADQGLGFVGWQTTGARPDVYRARVLSVLAAVLRLRLTEELREGQAVTYSPSAGSSTSWAFDSYGYLSAAIEAPPERLDGFFADVDRIAASLRDTPITADELERARRPLVESLQRNRAGNEYWNGNLAGLQTDPTRLPAIRSAVSDLERVTPEDIQVAAQAYLTPDRAWRARVIPEAAE